jgi:hypothetical protein
MSDGIDAQQIVRALAEFDVRTGPPLVARRRRRVLPFRVLRLLIPHVVVRVGHAGGKRTVSAWPDALAWFMLVLCSGGVLVELTMDRARFPREYPPAFIYGLAVFYVVALVVELRTSKSAATRALA